MKITELDGLIKLEAEEGKVLTTLAPSNLRAKLLYTSKDNKNNYIEVDEEPEIELPEEPDINEPEEILNGYTLAEAYYKLINENRVLEERMTRLEKMTREQNELINTIMSTRNEKSITSELSSPEA